jgi:hypothetical protein
MVNSEHSVTGEKLKLADMEKYFYPQVLADVYRIKT